MLRIVEDNNSSCINEEACSLLNEHLAECQTSIINGVIIISIDGEGNPYYSHTSMSIIDVLGAVELVKYSIMDNQDE